MEIKTVEVNTHSIRYVEEGKPGGDVILFIHGWGVSPYTYKDSILALGKHSYVIAPYIRGIENIQTTSDFLANFMDAIRISSAVVIGHSFSGIVATGLAFYYPKRIKALVLIDTIGIDFGRSKAGWIIAWLRHVTSLLFGPHRDSPKFLARLTGDFVYHVFRYPRELYKEIQLMFRIDISEMIQKLHTPILVLTGKDDILVPKEVGEKIARLNKNATFKTMPGSHNWAKTQVEALAREVGEFVRNLS